MIQRVRARTSLAALQLAISAAVTAIGGDKATIRETDHHLPGSIMSSTAGSGGLEIEPLAGLNGGLRHAILHLRSEARSREGWRVCFAAGWSFFADLRNATECNKSRSGIYSIIPRRGPDEGRHPAPSRREQPRLVLVPSPTRRAVSLLAGMFVGSYRPQRYRRDGDRSDNNANVTFVQYNRHRRS